MSGETEQNVSGWTVDTLHTHFARQLAQMAAMTEERHRAQGEAIDKAFAAQQAAMHAAFAAQQKATETAFASQDRAMSAALAAAKEAVSVANTANEKRFESVNEFRGQLADIMRTLMPRAEAEAVMSRETERLNDLVKRAEHWPTRGEMGTAGERNAERINDVGVRVDRIDKQLGELVAKGVGAKENKAGIYAVISIVGVLLGILVIVANYISGG
jgi:hypothetical protein